jgi:hypothetical protein
MNTFNTSFHEALSAADAMVVVGADLCVCPPRANTQVRPYRVYGYTNTVFIIPLKTSSEAHVAGASAGATCEAASLGGDDVAKLGQLFQPNRGIDLDAPAKVDLDLLFASNQKPNSRLDMLLEIF